MYRRELVHDPESQTPKSKSDRKPATEKNVQKSRTRKGSKARMSEGERPWPNNSNALFRQIMLLLRDLDNMFKASYNQRYDLRILYEDREAYAEWMKQQLPQLMPKQVTLAQSTP